MGETNLFRGLLLESEVIVMFKKDILIFSLIIIILLQLVVQLVK